MEYLDYKQEQIAEAAEAALAAVASGDTEEDADGGAHAAVDALYDSMSEDEVSRQSVSRAEHSLN